MTTIAFGRDGVAWDGLMTNRNRIVKRDTVKVQVRHNTIFGITGMISAMEPSIKWFFDGADGYPPKGGGDSDSWYCLLVMTEETFKRGVGLRFIHDSFGGEEHPLPFAAGSGADFAFGAMQFGEPGGLDALPTIELICRHLTDSGGTPQYLAYAEVWPALRAVA